MDSRGNEPRFYEMMYCVSLSDRQKYISKTKITLCAQKVKNTRCSGGSPSLGFFLAVERFMQTHREVTFHIFNTIADKICSYG